MQPELFTQIKILKFSKPKKVFCTFLWISWKQIRNCKLQCSCLSCFYFVFKFQMFFFFFNKTLNKLLRLPFSWIYYKFQFKFIGCRHFWKLFITFLEFLTITNIRGLWCLMSVWCVFFSTSALHVSGQQWCCISATLCKQFDSLKGEKLIHSLYLSQLSNSLLGLKWRTSHILFVFPCFYFWKQVELESVYL